MRPLFFLVPLAAVSLWAAAPPAPKGDIPDFIKGAEGLDDALRNLKAKMETTPVLSAKEARKKFKPRPGLAVDLIASEPVVKQPLYIAFDERGRMWVTQYRQYPFPAGLKVVEYDRYIRAKFDKVPPPPPDHFKGDDRITIHEDERGDGSFTKVTTFIDGLNIATAALPGDGGVWVMNPPYLLFYPTKDDRPGRPVVHLSGFGLEDTHAVASSLCWGPDGWLYGAQGSTCTAKVRVEVTKAKATTDFLGQAIWRYHPTRHVFEIFAEGGGNTFGVAFDEVGRVYSGTNWGTYRGLHYVQGGYYVKGWGKHGPLTNPYALGFFGHMPHKGDADRLTHQFIVYDDGVIPELQGKIIGVNALQKRLQVTQLHADRSTFRTVEEPFLLTTPDGRFRPVDVKPGPDGTLYVADLYEPRINHVDPRDNWDRATGRIWRIRPEKMPRPTESIELHTAKSVTLALLLTNSGSRHERETALRLLAQRKDGGGDEVFANRLAENDIQALRALWGIHRTRGLDDKTALTALAHVNPHVRRWAVRLVGDERKASPGLASAFARLAAAEKDPEVRSQLASTAKRLPADAALPILAELWKRDEDIADPHIPLLTWWALESKAETARPAIVKLLADDAVRSRPMVERFILERIMQRWAMAGGEANLLACATLLGAAGKKADVLLSGLEKGFAGRSTGDLPKGLRDAVMTAWARGNTAATLTLGLRLGHAPAVKRALAVIADEKAAAAARLDCIRIAGEADIPDAVPALLAVAKGSKNVSLRQEALGALARYKDAGIAPAALALLGEPEAVRNAALGLLASRPAWGSLLLAEVEAKKVSAGSVPFEVVHRLSLHKELAERVTKQYGKVRGGDPEKRKREILRVAAAMKKGKGDVAAGKAVFKEACAKCHKLFGEGGDVGPELTGYERSNPVYWMENIIDPSAVIREEYMMFTVKMEDGRTLTGVVAGQDKTTVTLRDQEGRTAKLSRAKIEEMSASPVSIMPEGQLRTMSDQQVRDLFAYLMSPKPGR